MSNTSTGIPPLNERLTEESRRELTQRAGCDSSTWRAEAFTTHAQISDELERVRAPQTPPASQPAQSAQAETTDRQAAKKERRATKKERRAAKKERRAKKKDRRAANKGLQTTQDDLQGKAASQPPDTERQRTTTEEPNELLAMDYQRAIEIVQRALDDALLAIAPCGHERMWVSLKLFYSGARIEHAWRAIHRARAALYMLYPPYELTAQAESLPGLVSALPESSALLKSLTNILTKLKPEPVKPTLTIRAELREVYEQTAVTSEALQREARILRNALLTASAALLSVVVVLGGLHAVNTEVISVCAKNATHPSQPFCPMGHGSERFDVFAVELAGMLGGLLSVAIPIATGERINTPYRVFNQQLVLKTFAGAATALAGVMLIVSGLIPGFVFESDSAILGYAVFFGIAQQAVTGAVDRRANTLAEKTPDFKSV
jgi:hypothetical protein